MYKRQEEKLARKAAAREEARKNGTYETKKQREARLAAERRRASMLASGMISVDAKPSKPKFERKKKKVVEKKESSFSAARNMFGAKAKAKGRKRASTSGGSTDCHTQHKGAIVDMNPLSTPGEEVTKVAMSSVDGRMIFWDV